MGDVDLLERQQRLQADADEVCRELALDRLATWGEPVRVGSSALGLMVRRDVDITVVCPSLDEELVRQWAQFGSELVRHPRVRVVSLRDDTGPFNTDPDYPDGLYLGVTYRRAPGDDWNLDIWAMDEPGRQPDLAHLGSLRPALDEAARLAILRIKTAWADHPGYGSEVSSHDIYDAVLHHGVGSVEEFERHRAARAT